MILDNSEKMRLLLKLGFLLLTLQLMQIQGKITLNPDENRSIQENMGVTVLTKSPSNVRIASSALLGKKDTQAVNTQLNNLSEKGVTQQLKGRNDPHFLPVLTGTIRPINDAANNAFNDQVALRTGVEVTTIPLDEDVSLDNAATTSVMHELRLATETDDKVVFSQEPTNTDMVANNVRNSNDTDQKQKQTKIKSDIFDLPDGIEYYSNSIMLEGHVFGISDDVLSMIHSSLSTGNIFVPVEQLNIHPLSSSFEEMGYEGDKVTSIKYVVSYNGFPVHTEVISRLMSSPQVSHHFSKQLEGRHLRQYKEARHVKNKSWIQNHRSAVVIPSCLAFVLIILLVVVVVIARKRSAKVHKLEEKRPMKCQQKEKKKCSPPPYSVENPIYDFEANAVMDGYTLP